MGNEKVRKRYIVTAFRGDFIEDVADPEYRGKSVGAIVEELLNIKGVDKVVVRVKKGNY